MSDELPKRGRLMGIDFGTVRIGLAITDPEQTLASPFQIYQPRNEALDSKFFRDVARLERIAGFVVGLPVHLDGRDSQVSVRAEEFGAWLGKTTELPVVFFDERFTTSFADDVIREAGLTKAKGKQLRDKLAAQILLTAFLESSRRGQKGSGTSIG